jgi:hypothetical protein
MASKSKARRRAASGRGRRTPVRAQGGRSIPWLPAAVLGAVVAVIVLIVFVIWQSMSGSDENAAQLAEADSSASLPGEYIDLPAIYGGPYGETAGHVTRDIDYTADCSAADETLCNTNPPVGGPHWSGRCADDPASSPAFCGPARWGVYRDDWAPETLVHNMEHGGVVIWYNTTDQDVIDALEALVTKHVEDDDLVVLAPYPDMEAETVAITSWTRIDKFAASEYDDARIETFLDAHMRRFNPEHF